MSMLSIAGLRAGYGRIEVLHDVALTVAQGQIVTLIGANGAGKTTLLKTISGLIRPNAGSIDFEGESIARRPPHRIVARGISHVPEGRAILKRMTVLDNLRMGAFVRRDAEVARDIDAVFVRFPALGERRAQMAGTLSRRRAADAGDRPRAGGAPAAAAARRALARARAEVRHADLPHAARAASRRARPSFWSNRMRAKPCRLPTPAT